MRNITLLSIFLILFFAGCSRPPAVPEHTLPSACAVYDMKQARCIGEAELAARLEPCRVVFVGDHHESEALHRKVAELIAVLGKRGRHVMLANEWFTPGDDRVLARYAAGTFEGNFTAAVNWKKQAGYPFASYAPVYDAVRAVGGELYGVNMPKSFQKLISENNVSQMNASERGFVRGLDLNLTAHRQMLSPFFSHCHSKKEGESTGGCAERMYRVQVAWDSYMAKESAKLARRLLKTPRDLLMVFAGAMHLKYGLGINARFARLSREPFVTILPVPEGTRSAEVGEADYLLFYPEKGADEWRGRWVNE